jgi:hypothetical protein
MRAVIPTVRKASAGRQHLAASALRASLLATALAFACVAQTTAVATGAGAAAPRNQPAAAPAVETSSGSNAAICRKRDACPGPKIGSEHFALLTESRISVAGAVASWGDYVKLKLVVVNSTPQTISFTPAAVSALMADGRRQSPVNVEELDVAPSRPFNIGSGPVSGMPYPEGTNTGTQTVGMPPPAVIAQVLNPDPIGAMDAARESKELGKHRTELKSMLNDQLRAVKLESGETLAGFVLVPKPDKGKLQAIVVTVAGRKFQLPAE